MTRDLTTSTEPGASSGQGEAPAPPDSARNFDTAPARTATQADRAEARTLKTLDFIETLTHQFDEEIGLPVTPLNFEIPNDFLLSAVIPVFNEQQTICRVVGSLLALPLPIEIIVVDDGSTDDTCAVLTQLNRKHPTLRVLFQETNLGKGAALRRGFAAATGSHLIVQDADLEYDPRDIPGLVRALIEEDLDVVYGSRFLEARHEGSSALHRWGNHCLTQLSNWSTGWTLTDMETCYKLFRRDLLERFELEQNGFGFEVELTAKLAGEGARYGERPVSYHARGWEDGKKIHWRDGLNALWCLLRYRMKPNQGSLAPCPESGPETP